MCGGVADAQGAPEFPLEKIERAKRSGVASEVGQRPGEEIEDSGYRGTGFRHQIREFDKVTAQKKIRARESRRIERLEDLHLPQGVQGGFPREHKRDFADVKEVEFSRERTGRSPCSPGHGGNLPMPEGQPRDDPTGIAPSPSADQNGR